MAFSGFADTARDLVRTVKLSEIWGYLAVDDVVARYKRTILGPIWNAGYLLGTALAIGVVFGAIFNQPIAKILPYIVAGLIAWNMAPGLVIESANLMVVSAGAIKSSNLPYFFYGMRSVARAFLFYLHNIAVLFLVLIFFRLPLFFHWSLAAALILSIIATIPFVMLMALLCARFRDIQMFMNSFASLLYFVTPIMWFSDQLKGPRAIIVKYNPLYYFVDLIRAPLLNQMPHLSSWEVVLIAAILGWSSCFLVMSSVRNRIAFWV